ncbi:hypothetical protein GQ53DRAFT_97705 [Thozetella sp. PMI_491]|nr:hypothetical protein GQ53DRAFT_97705 [Thozetella sp. PMI_491]
MSRRLRGTFPWGQGMWRSGKYRRPLRSVSMGRTPRTVRGEKESKCWRDRYGTYTHTRIRPGSRLELERVGRDQAKLPRRADKLPGAEVRSEAVGPGSGTPPPRIPCLPPPGWPWRESERQAHRSLVPPQSGLHLAPSASQAGVLRSRLLLEANSAASRATQGRRAKAKRQTKGPRPANLQALPLAAS